MKNLVIREDQAIAIGNYLAHRPYAEVVGLIAILQSMREMPAPEAADADADELAAEAGR